MILFLLFLPIKYVHKEIHKMVKIELIHGDITIQDVDAIVNAAHEGLSGGGGVDGAIHRAAGPTMTGECLNLYGCEVGQARITGGYNLPAKYILHTVGPVWRGGTFGEKEDLANCYKSCLSFAYMQGLKSIAFPCISTGAFCFPKDLACKIAIEAVDVFAFVRIDPSVELVRFVCFEQEDYNLYMDRMVALDLF